MWLWMIFVISRIRAVYVEGEGKIDCFNNIRITLNYVFNLIDKKHEKCFFKLLLQAF